MSKRPRIRNTILFYFYGTLLLIFAVLVLSFNLASRNQVESLLKDRLAAAEQLVTEFTDSSTETGASGRRYALSDMMHSSEDDSGVSLLFLNSQRELTLELVDQSGQGGRGGGRGNMHGRPNTTPEAGEEEEDAMLLGHRAYLESMAIYDYVKASGYVLSDPAVKQVSIDEERYYLQSTPFSTGSAPLEEYVLTFVGGAAYDDFLGNALRILALLMGPILLLTFFIVRYLANRLARPISQLQALSGRLGAGVFKGEDFQLHERELKDLNDSLNETAEKLKTYDENQKRFFQNFSHELRTPLTNIKGYAEGIRFGVFDKDQGAEVIMNESLRLEKLVNDILYLSRIQSGAMVQKEKTRVRLSELLFESREQVLGDASLNHKEIQIKLRDDPWIEVYFEELSRALVNLLANAIRYAQKNIWLEGGRDGNRLIITVADDGRGIEPGEEENIFQRFSKGTDGKHGIGLSIVRASVEQHGGTVTAGQRGEGSGARFTISLPLKGEASTL